MRVLRQACKAYGILGQAVLIYLNIGIIITEVTGMQSVDLKKRKRAVKIANAVNSIDGVPASECSRLLSDRWSNGEITTEQMRTELLMKYRSDIS